MNFFRRIISEARSYGETLVHPQTKTLVPSSQQYRSQNTSLYDKPLSTILMDEADAMAERDMGSTFLLPHTHLYKPGDRVNIWTFLSFKYKTNTFFVHNWHLCFLLFCCLRQVMYPVSIRCKKREKRIQLKFHTTRQWEMIVDSLSFEPGQLFIISCPFPCFLIYLNMDFILLLQQQQQQATNIECSPFIV